MKKSILAAVCVAALSVTGAASVAASQADNYPTRAVHIIDGYAPGGSTDVMARFVANGLAQKWGTPVVVENRTGASGQVGAAYVARSDPDGYSVMIAPNPGVLIVAPMLHKNLPYNVDKDLVPIAMVAEVPLVMVVHPSFPATNVKEFIEYAKANPGKVSYGSAGKGTTPHLSAAMFTSMADIDMLHVPYKGAAPAVQDLLGGHVDVVFSSISAVLTQIQAGNLRALGVTGTQQVSLLPDVPVLADTLPGYESILWQVMVAPSGTPQPVIDKWNSAVREIMMSEESKNTFLPQGIVPAGDTLDQLQQRIAKERVRWEKVIKDANITLD